MTADIIPLPNAKAPPAPIDVTPLVVIAIIAGLILGRLS